MNNSSKTSPTSLTPAHVVDTGLALIGLVLIGLLVWNTIRIKATADLAYRNKTHLCWMMNVAFGPPDGGQIESCEKLRDTSVEIWEAYDR